MDYEIIVVGGGHAGCEAALAASKRHKTLLVTGNINNIATMPCNPSIGGSAKGIVVREIDALGGYMGKCADKTLLQQKMLNKSKGPAVKSLRAQADKITYPKEMKRHLEEQPNLKILEGMVEDLIVENNIVKGIILEDNTKITSNIVILTTGTYLKSDILVGNTRTSSGPNNEKNSKHLSDNLKKYGFNILRLKTGTPQRIERSSIDFSKTKREEGDSEPYTFSFDNEVFYDVNNQEPCHLIYTTDETKKIILDNLNKSSMYGGLDDITGVGPRYCPSIEDKMVRFKDKDKHQLFLEPESKYYDDIYLQGFSTSMPKDIQEAMVHSLPGLENAIIKKYAYAIEYDAIYPTQINASLETKIIENLFTAGQINGTSGYEEAACQGLMAGINASLKLENKEPLILKRNEAYIGVLIDDLVTKGTKEPYRLLTSRAEYRLLLRHDNADLRLTDYGYKVGMIDEERYSKFKNKKENINHLLEYLNTIKIDKIDATTYLKRPENKIKNIINYLDKEYSEEELEQVEIILKYEGYIKKITKEAERMLKLEYKKIPDDIDYDKIINLASEARQKLKEVRPTSLGQAMRISGVNPSDISILTVYMKRYFKNE
ncbi:MAG: tRNA uridine-5-carboxymethylaminomethyl(34) synthesis enzyme MnmG [Bacilli bacterium]|nr:tRNA uridine-5-carboxymethylaminomethyl(34) synthesis enzyme MnmG [Bacilli bacterium]MBQ6282983.1 tRNA uridine-5-carboxymethylaminomethyl(34) synthesis enzyme MnmG [Bacilli bacterium]